MQLILPHELPVEEYFWLHYLRDNISSREDIETIAREYQSYKNSGLHQAVMDAIVRGNIKNMEVEQDMCEALYELFADELNEREILGRREGRQEGERTGRIQSIFELLEDLGTVPEKISQKIMEEKDINILSKWHKAAAKATTMEEFHLN